MLINVDVVTTTGYEYYLDSIFPVLVFIIDSVETQKIYMLLIPFGLCQSSKQKPHLESPEGTNSRDLAN